MSDLNDIWTAIRSLEAAAEKLYYSATNVEQRDRVRDFQFAAKRGMEAYNRLSSKLPRAMELLAASEREYDRYVTREPECCSCHINAPCGFCLAQSDEEAA